MGNVEHAGLVDYSQARQYFDALFGIFDIPDGAAGRFAVRGVGEKGTPGDSLVRSSEWTDGSDADLEEKMKRWAAHDVGAFLVPGFVRGDTMAPSNIKEDDVVAFTALLVDIDKGDPMIALKYACGALGNPTMVVQSGGTTELGKPKLHVYWCFTESNTDTHKIADARLILAMKLGGDPSFVRIPQIIRIPGSVHLKGSVPNRVKIVHCDTSLSYDADELIDKIETMQPAPGQEQAYKDWCDKKSGALMSVSGGGINFGPGSAGVGGGGVGQTLVSDIHEGGEGADTRWSKFNEVAGHYIHCARRGEITIEEALTYSGGWVSAHMVPPWEPARVQKEFRGILVKDLSEKGAVVPPSEQRALVVSAPSGDTNPDPENPLLAWSPARWVREGEIPERKWLVKGLVPAGKPCALVAEGGAGKTYMSLDLGLKLAGGSPDNPQTWLGEAIPNDAYGPVVVITAEDDRDELAIRLHEIDQKGLRFAAGDRLIVLPLINVGGTFPLASSRRVHKDNMTVEEHGPTEKWDQMMAMLKGIVGLKLVIIDTLNATMHGEENSATVVQEYFRQATRVCGEMGAALMVTHHFRKQNPKDPIISIADADAAGRGSGAIKSSVRQVITFWEAHNWKSAMEGLKIEPKPKMLYRMAVTKANNRDALSGMKVLLRNEVGTLDDITQQAAVAVASKVETTKAWLMLAVGMAADAGHPYTASRGGAKSCFTRKGELPAAVRYFSGRNFETTIADLVRDGVLVSDVKGHLCVPGSLFAGGHATVLGSGVYTPPDWSLYEWDNVAGAVLPRVG